MAVYSGPEISNNKLAVCLDATNIKSYPGSGNIWYDISGNNRHFTGNASFIDSVNGIRSGATWTLPSASVGNIMNTDTHSVFFIIRYNSTGTFPQAHTGSWNKIFEHTGSSGDRSPGVWRYPSNRRIHWRYNPSNTGIDFGDPAGSGGDFIINQWYYIGVTKNNSDTRAYLNGQQTTTATTSFPKQTGVTNINLFPGYPADIANIVYLTIYDRVLNASEIYQNYVALRKKYGV